ncbi:MAG: hypothetical protein J6J29_03855 [Paludibacteraceae bacterium]|nr:hypothetical protein [Paludibacteraceae bacterium]
MEWLKQFIELINDNAGVIAVFSFVAAIVVPIVIYRMQRQDAIRDAKQDAQDQLDAMNEVSRFSFTEEGRKHYAKKGYLRKKANR